MTTPGQAQNLRFWEELRVANDALPAAIRYPVLRDDNQPDVEHETVLVAGPPGAAPDSDVLPEYTYLERHVLVRDDGDVERVTEEISLRDRERGPVNRVQHDDFSARAGVARLYLGRDRDVHSTLNDLQSLNYRLGRQVAAPDYFVSVTAPPPGVTICPAGEPVPSGGSPIPPIGGHDAGRDVRVLVIDTGLVHDALTAHHWMADIDPGSEFRTGQPVEHELIPEYFGHGTFVAGVLKCVAPGTKVKVSNTMTWAGGEMSSRLGGMILEALDRLYPEPEEWPDIISLSAGTSTLDNQQFSGFELFLAALHDHPKTVLVAAAGNDGSDRPFWPAALAGSFPGPIPGPVPGVVSVGALREDGRGRACFSNHGDWVKVYAPGERLVNAFTRGRYKYEHSHFASCRYYTPPLYSGCTCVSGYHAGDVVQFNGMAQWSGTSFATPIVAGLIATRMSQTGESARTAAEALQKSALSVPDLSDYLRTARG